MKYKNIKTVKKRYWNDGLNLVILFLLMATH